MDGEAEIERNKKIRVPKHKIIHSGEIDMGNFVGDESQQSAFQALPQHLKLVVNLPTVKSAAEIDLDTSTDNVILEVARKFYLDLPLPFDVDESKAKAKFDKDTSVLTLTLPVIPKIYEKIEQPKTVEVMSEILDGDISENDSDVGLPELRDPVKKDTQKAASDTAQQEKADETKAVSRSSELVGETKSSLEFATQKPVEIAADDPRDIYQACEQFDGARPGYVFKKGSRGIGYYRDAYQAPIPVEKAAVLAADGDDLLDKIAGRKKAEPETVQDDSAPLVQEVNTPPVWTPPALSEQPSTTKGDAVVDDRAPASLDSKSKSSAVDQSTAAASADDGAVESNFSAPTAALLGNAQTSGQKDAEEEPNFVVSQNWQNAWFVFDFAFDDVVEGSAKVRLFDMVLVVQFCTKESESLQVRHTVSRLLCQNVDIEQCHFERLGLSADAKLALVIRKSETWEGDWLGEICEIEFEIQYEISHDGLECTSTNR